MQRWLFIAAALTAFIIALSVAALNGPARVGAAYKAKTLCSETFIANRPADLVAAKEFNDLSPVFPLIRYDIDLTAKTVRTSLLGFGGSKAIYRDGAGCTLLNGKDTGPVKVSVASSAMTPLPTAHPISSEAIHRVDYGAVNAILNEAMQDQAASHRSFVILVDGKIVDERYTEGFSKDTAFLSWSMAKSVLATFVGAAVEQEIISIDDPAPVPEWKNDARAAITWNDLLRMQTGLKFEEIYESISSDVNQMLFNSAEMGAVAAAMPAIHTPGEHWYYSSGTSNLLARTLQAELAKRDTSLQDFARSTIFNPIGASSFVLETDTAGNFIGSSYVYATARDWARLGQLYLQDGKWDGKKILSPEWVSYVQEPAKASDGQYGAHFWLNIDGEDGRKRWIEGLPEDVYTMAGHEGQYVFIIPSKNTVIVRTGLTRGQPAIEVVGPVIKKLYDSIGDPV